MTICEHYLCAHVLVILQMSVSSCASVVLSNRKPNPNSFKQKAIYWLRLNLTLESVVRGSRCVIGTCPPFPPLCSLWCSILKAFLLSGKTLLIALGFGSQSSRTIEKEGSFPSVATGNVPRLCHIDSHAHLWTSDYGWRDVMLLLVRHGPMPP